MDTTQLQYIIDTVGPIMGEKDTKLREAVSVYESVKFPRKTTEWLEYSEAFYNRWNFPHCLGTIDRKHIVIQALKNSDSHYYTYKGIYSIVLLAVFNADYKFTYND